MILAPFDLDPPRAAATPATPPPMPPTPIPRPPGGPRERAAVDAGWPNDPPPPPPKPSEDWPDGPPGWPGPRRDPAWAEVAILAGATLAVSAGLVWLFAWVADRLVGA